MLTKMQSGEDFAIQTKGGGKIVVPNVVTEPQFNPTSAYAVDAKVWYGDVQYICMTATMEPAEGQANPTPEEDTSHWSALPAEEMAKKSESVRATRTINGKALSSDVALTGADIAVSGVDATKISDALAGKLSRTEAIDGFTEWEASSVPLPGYVLYSCTYNGHRLWDVRFRSIDPAKMDIG